MFSDDAYAEEDLFLDTVSSADISEPKDKGNDRSEPEHKPKRELMSTDMEHHDSSSQASRLPWVYWAKAKSPVFALCHGKWEVIPITSVHTTLHLLQADTWLQMLQVARSKVTLIWVLFHLAAAGP